MRGKIKIYKVPFLNEQKSCFDTFKFVKIQKKKQNSVYIKLKY